MVANEHSEAFETLVSWHKDRGAGCGLYNVGEGGGEYGGEECG